MTIFSHPRFLRSVLIADAASGAGTALLQLTGAGLLAGWLGLPVPLLVGSGLALILYVAGAAWLAACDPVPRGQVNLLIAANWAWVGGCVTLLVTGVATTTLGQAYLVMQAVVVALLAELQWFGLRRYAVRGWA